MHAYYAYTADELMQKAKLPVVCMESSEQVFRRLAGEMAGEIEKNNAAGRRTVLICPVGPVGQYPYFVELVLARKIDLRNCWFFNMDEYLDGAGRWIDAGDRLSFRGFMQREVYGRLPDAQNVPTAQRIFPDPGDPAALTRKLEALGGADVCFGGIGINGHLAFNEPQPGLTAAEFGRLSTRALAISPETRTANAIGDLGGAIEDMPRMAVTVGMREILAAKKVRLGVFRPWHRAVVRRAACGEIGADFPVSLLQTHPDAVIYANDVAAERPLA